MRVLFVSTGNYIDGISPIIKIQGESLMNTGAYLDFFTIKGKGKWAYFRHIFILRKYLKTNKFDIIHAHYSFSAFVATFAGGKPLVVSLMGSDVIKNKTSRIIIHFLNRFYWNALIVKTQQMEALLKISNALVLPNGVNIDIFKPMDKDECRAKLKWQSNKIHLLFVSNPNRIEKNFLLVKEAVDLIEFSANIEVHTLNDITPQEVPIYINAADIVLLSSHYEGSPNVIKETMACNCPIVATDVGDVKWILGNSAGCFIASFNSKDYAQKIKQALEFRNTNGQTKGRERIIELGLDSVSTAKKIIEVYVKTSK